MGSSLIHSGWCFAGQPWHVRSRAAHLGCVLGTTLPPINRKVELHALRSISCVFQASDFVKGSQGSFYCPKLGSHSRDNMILTLDPSYYDHSLCSCDRGA